MMTKTKKMLFISPCFFDYYKDIISQLEKENIEVTWFNDRPSESFIGKTIIRLNKRLMFYKNKRYFKKILENCMSVNYDYVFVIFGQFLNRKYVEELRKIQNHAKFIYYTWDSAKNYSSINEIADLFDERFSFDSSDCSEFGFKFLPLFYSELNSNVDVSEKYLASTVFTVKPGKLHNYTLVKKLLPENGIYEHLYIQSRLVYLFYKLKYRKEFKNYKMKDFKYKKLSRNEALFISLCSKIVLDVQMQNQIGLTMRTFETLSIGKKLITTNSSIKNYDFYDENNIFVVDENTKAIPDSFLETNFLENSCLKNYTIENFIKRIIY